MPRYTKEELEAIVENNDTITDVLKHFNLTASGGNCQTFKKWCYKWGIDYSHFLSNSEIAKRNWTNKIFQKRELNDILVQNSTYNNRTSLKRRLYAEGLKQPICEICSQNEIWNGKRMSLILDHINGANSDNRLENLRIVCPNCNATLPTHGGKNISKKSTNLDEESTPMIIFNENKNPNWRKLPRPKKEKIEWPDINSLIKMVKNHSYSEVGRILGLSDNAVRKRIKTRTKSG